MMRKRQFNRRRRPNTYRFKRTLYVDNYITCSNTSDVAFSFIPNLAQLPSSTDFTAMFDQYKISGVAIKIIPRFNVLAATANGSSQILTCVDYDANGPSTLSAIQQYQSMKLTRGTSIHRRYIKPAILVQAYQGVTSTGYLPKWNTWIDANDNAVPHYGLYGVVPAAAGGSQITYDLEATFYVQCKYVR